MHPQGIMNTRQVRWQAAMGGLAPPNGDWERFSTTASTFTFTPLPPAPGSGQGCTDTSHPRFAPHLHLQPFRPGQRLGPPPGLGQYQAGPCPPFGQTPGQLYATPSPAPADSWGVGANGLPAAPEVYDSGPMRQVGACLTFC
jgi:hypothetical protein